MYFTNYFKEKFRKLLRYTLHVTRYKNKGFTFIEVIIAISVITTGIVGTMLAVQKVIYATQQSYSRLTAAYLAQEGIEIVRNVRDTNWLQQRSVAVSWDDGLAPGNYEADYTVTTQENPTLTPCASPCGYENLSFLAANESDFYNYFSSDETQFKRRITIEKPAADFLRVLVTVYWNEGKDHLTIHGDFYDWR